MTKIYEKIESSFYLNLYERLNSLCDACQEKSHRLNVFPLRKVVAMRICAVVVYLSSLQKYFPFA